MEYEKNRDFRRISRFISEMIKDRAIVTMADWQRVVLWSIEWRHFQWLWTTPTWISRSRHYLMLTISETVRDTHKVTIEYWYQQYTVHTPYLRVSFEWHWVILSDSELWNIQWHEALRGLSATAELIINPLDSNAIIVQHRIIRIWYTGRWWVGCCISYSEEYVSN